MTTPSKDGVKGVKSARFDLLPPEAIWQIALIYGMGAQKYAERNWEGGYEYSKSYGALQRHLALFWAGEEVDEESGLPHMAHAAWHCLALLTFEIRRIGKDDRPLERASQSLDSMRAELTNPEIFGRVPFSPPDMPPGYTGPMTICNRHGTQYNTLCVKCLQEEIPDRELKE